ncbi:MAG: transcriptional regulator [Bradyrhizobium sp.]|nr:transcriptional regulator [Bradyrhizobium sp.]
MREQLQFPSWRGGRGERLWLSTLVETMEQVGQPARRAEPCDPHSLNVVRAQLALPAQLRFASPFSLRN